MAAIELDDEYEPKYTTWQDFDEDVRAHDGVLRVLMWDLRDLSGYRRLKLHVVATISEQLRSNGLDHLPQVLPRDRNQHVVVFKAGSAAGAVINAVRNGTSSEEAGRALRKLNTSDSIRADRHNEAKIAELTEKADEVDNLLQSIRAILTT
jgi:hypothetical protein